MNELININQAKIGDREVPTVNARELHAFLESKQEFSHWIKNRIKKYSFVQYVDFITIDNSITSPPSIDYYLTLDMAKELSMVERNERGKEARQYFLECERVAKQIDPMKALNNPVAMRGLLLTYSEKVIALESAVKEQAPKVAALDRISTADGLTCITDTAKSLQIRPTDLFTWMSANLWIYRRVGGKGWIAYHHSSI